MPLMRDIDMVKEPIFRSVNEVIEIAESIGWKLIAHEEFNLTFTKGPGNVRRFNISGEGLIVSHRFRKGKEYGYRKDHSE